MLGDTVDQRVGFGRGTMWPKMCHRFKPHEQLRMGKFMGSNAMKGEDNDAHWQHANHLRCVTNQEVEKYLPGHLPENLMK